MHTKLSSVTDPRIDQRVILNQNLKKESEFVDLVYHLLNRKNDALF